MFFYKDLVTERVVIPVFGKTVYVTVLDRDTGIPRMLTGGMFSCYSSVTIPC